jgi:pilus assembly protein CpaC
VATDSKMSRRLLALLCVLAFGAVVSPAKPASAQGVASPSNRLRRELTLTIGEQTSLPSENVRNYSVGSEDVLDVRLPRDGSQFILVGRRAGTTTLLFIMADGSQIQYRVTVVSGDTPRPDVEARDSIRLDLYFVQVSDSYVHQLGIAYPASFGTGLSLGGQFNFLTGAFNSAVLQGSNIALPRLDLLQTTGWARISRQAMLVTTNGSEAHFESGGEVNIRLQNGLTNGIQSVRYGSTIEVLPRYDRETGRVEMKISAEVADLTDDRGTGVPGRTTSNIEALVNVQAGQSIVLGGLTSESEQTSRSGLPGLSQIPILGMLFGTHGQRIERLRNVLIIVPTVVDTVAPQARNHIREAMRLYEGFDGDTDETELLPSLAAPAAAAPSSGARAPLIVPAD